MAQAFEMNSAGFSPSIAFSAPAGATTVGARVYVAFGDFVPPFLLMSRPDLLATASLALEILVDVVPALHKIRHAVAVVGSQVLDIDGNALAHLSSMESCLRFRGANLAPGLQLSSALLPLFIDLA